MAIMQHPWPGNVRELENTIERAVVLNSGDTVTLDMMPQLHAASGGVRALPYGADSSRKPPAPGSNGGSGEPAGNVSIQSLWQVEKNHIQRAMDLSGGNVSRAAAMLEIGTSTLYRRLKEFEEG